MPGPRCFRFRKITVTASAFTAVAVVLIGVAVAGIWHHVADVALDDDRSGAVVASLAAVILWSARWLAGFIAGGGMLYVIDMMLIQRASTRRLRAVTGPLRVPSARHARR